MSELFSGTVTRLTQKKRGRKQEIAPTPLPKELAKVSDLYAAGKSVLKEISFKVEYAENQVKDFCLRNFVQLFSNLKKKPPSLEYTGPHSRFKFVYTHRTTLTADKVDYLRSRNIPIDEYSELSGIRMNMDAIRRHGLEKKIRDALDRIGVSKAVIEECFTPDVQLNPSFYDDLFSIVRNSLQGGENLEEKMLEVVTTLRPAVQVRNLEVKDLSVEDSFDLIMRTEIETEDFDVA